MSRCVLGVWAKILLPHLEYPEKVIPCQSRLAQISVKSSTTTNKLLLGGARPKLIIVKRHEAELAEGENSWVKPRKPGLNTVPE